MIRVFKPHHTHPVKVVQKAQGEWGEYTEVMERRIRMSIPETAREEDEDQINNEEGNSINICLQSVIRRKDRFWELALW